jgi:CBS domain-containing protein
MRAKGIMTNNVDTITPDTGVAKIARILTDN